MKKELLDEISKEIIKLQSEDYRREVKMWANEKQIRKLIKLFSKARSLKKEAVFDFSRYVSDIASTNSKIFTLVEEFFNAVENDNKGKLI